MTNYFQNLDAQLGQLQFSFLSLYGGDSPNHYWRSAKMLYLFNMSLPPDARVTDMKPLAMTDKCYDSMIQAEAQAMEYCDLWSPAIFSSATIYRDKMLKELNQE